MSPPRVPRLLLEALPYVVVVVGIKLVLVLTGVEPLEPNPLLSGLVAATVFLLGFLLAGTASDYKEAERLPGELAASIDTIADECLIVWADKREPRAVETLEQLRTLAVSIREWLHHQRPFDNVLAQVRALNEPFLVFTPLTLPGFVARVKSEQHALRRTLVRIEAIRRTSFVAAGYAIAELTGSLLLFGLLFSEVGPLAESLFFTGVITLLMTYLFLLVHDLDNPFGYERGEQGAADVSLQPLDDVVKRLAAERARLDAALPG